ncbi:unnamed protein product [Thlaspi arvense]|uniref:Uncharacterized protein n=1 Tax=Thlaspi arvense TaxID=13288 RepID=A0AAU9RIU5_THLAR|nr:unnamed protein product [Thlaspi arvense]
MRKIIGLVEGCEVYLFNVEVSSGARQMGWGSWWMHISRRRAVGVEGSRSGFLVALLVFG